MTKKRKKKKKTKKNITLEKLLPYLEKAYDEDCWWPMTELEMTLNGETVLSIDKDFIITVQGLEHVGEYDFKKNRNKLKIFQEIILK